MFWCFKKKNVEKLSAIPKVGEKWFFKSNDGSPWPSQYFPVTILDVKDGWVRYSFHSVFTDERHKISTFTNMYQRENENDRI